MCKKKHMTKTYMMQKGFSRLLPLFAFVFAVFLLLPADAAAEQALRTRDSQSSLNRDPATGDRSMRTPEAVHQQNDMDPQTIIVAPEITYGPMPDSGSKPGQGERPSFAKPGAERQSRPHTVPGERLRSATPRRDMAR